MSQIPVIPIKVSESQTVSLGVSEESQSVPMNVDEEEEIHLKVQEGGGSGGTNDYRTLLNKPKINGETLFGNYNEKDPTVPSWAKKENKPAYNYSEVGAVGAENELHFEEIDRMFNAVFGI